MPYDVNGINIRINKGADVVVNESPSKGNGQYRLKAGISQAEKKHE